MDAKTKRDMDRLLAGGELSGPESDEIWDRIVATQERLDGVTTVLELSCGPGTLSACPKSSTLVFSASGRRAASFLSAYAEAIGHDAEPVFYFSEEDGAPKLAEPEKGARIEHTVAVSAAHRVGRYRVHAYLADHALERQEMVEDAEDVTGIAARLRVEIVIVE